MDSVKVYSSLKLGSVPVLCVDLDGTLLATDVLWESFLLLIKNKPYMLVVIPLWLLKGKAYLKQRIAQEVELDPTVLPYREDVLSFLAQEKRAGREIVLATASDKEAVRSIAEHLGIFSDVIASDGKLNLSGRNKCNRLQRLFGYRGFDYIGNSTDDLPSWQSANAAILVEPSKRVLSRATRKASVQHVFRSRKNRAFAILKALRCYQWVKNALIFVPLLMSHKLFDGPRLLQAVCAFWAFSFCASSIYIVNDLLDLNADRKHPKKRFRPFAAGTLPISMGIIISPILILLSLLLAILTLPPLFLAGLGLYMVVTISYSFYLKKVAVMDTIILAGLYTLRVLVGGVAVDVTISTWLLAFSMFVFLCLAFAKRYAELTILQDVAQEQTPGRGYCRDDKNWMSSMGSASGYLSVLVLALYINSEEVMALYQYPKLLWLICPPLLYWISRIWLLASRSHLDDDPIVFTIKDPASYAVGALILTLMVAAS